MVTATCPNRLDEEPLWPIVLHVRPPPPIRREPLWLWRNLATAAASMASCSSLRGHQDRLQVMISGGLVTDEFTDRLQ